jgi:hypothetical protein
MDKLRGRLRGDRKQRAVAPASRALIEAHGVFAALHHEVTSELLRLLDGFYSNIEDGLFELAYRTGEDGQRRRCFDLMRELRFRRAGLVKNFARAMDRYRELWIDATDPEAELSGADDLRALVLKMAEKTNAHFSGVLNTIAERAEIAGARPFDKHADLPISPRRIAQAFVHSCRSLRLDQGSIEIVQELFSRFVLDGLGNVYGACNLRLQDEGYLTSDELGFVSSAS